jgi:hypothetical protein
VVPAACNNERREIECDQSFLPLYLHPCSNIFGKATAESALRHHTPAAWSSISGALRNAQSKNDCFLGGGNKSCRP